jgi:hypothetical protein
MNRKLYPTILSAVFLVACGGGGGGGGGDNGPQPAPVKLEPTSYTVYKTGQEAPLTGAGAVTDSKLSLGAGGNTTLSVTDANTYAMTATNTNYQVVNRRKGAVLMLCDPLPAGGKPGDTHAQYVAIATNSATAETQGTVVTNAVELAGKSFYEMDECSYVKRDGLFTSQQQNSAPKAGTLEFRVDASGNVRSELGLMDAATFTSLLNGGNLVDGQGRKIWFTAYKFAVGSEQKIYVAIRTEPRKDANGVALDAGFAVVWTDDPISDVVGCSLNCAKPTDAIPVTTPATVAGVYVTQYGFGDEVAAIWVDSAGNYSYAAGLAASSVPALFSTGLEFGTLAFDSSGNVSATKVEDKNGSGESILWSANATQVVSTAVADPTRHFVLERIAKDPANPIVGAWMVESCNGVPVGSAATDPRSRVLFVNLKSGHYVMLDPLGVAPNQARMEYGTFTFDSATGKQRITGNVYDTNGDEGLWDSILNRPGITEFELTFTDNGDTMNFSSADLQCGTGVSRRIN